MTTLSDIVLVPSFYTDIYSVAGITIGTSIIIQNKSSIPVLVQNKAVQPSPNNWDGVLIPKYGVWIVEVGSAGVWAKGDGPISVEVR